MATTSTHPAGDTPRTSRLVSASPVYRGWVILAVGSLGGVMTSPGVVHANYFGRRHLGSFAGFALSFMIAASALGRMPIGVARDLMGSYTAVLTGFAILPCRFTFERDVDLDACMQALCDPLLDDVCGLRRCPAGRAHHMAQYFQRSSGMS